MPKAETKTPERFPSETIASDDCIVEQDGTKYHPHAGEWVQVIRGPRSITELKVGWGFNKFQVELDALRSDQEEARRALNILIEKMPQAESDDDLTEAQKRDGAKLQVQIQARLEELAELNQKRFDRILERYDQFAEEVAGHLVDWNWTNRLGGPLPKPDGTIAPLQGLSVDEIYYLRQVTSGEGPGERGKG